MASAMLGLVESASAEDTRTMIERKLREMSKDPTDIHVIVQGTGDGTFYLVEFEGVILTVDALISGHVSKELELSTVKQTKFALGYPPAKC